MGPHVCATRTRDVTIGERWRRLVGHVAHDVPGPSDDAWAVAFDRLSRAGLTWDVAGREGSRPGAYAWQYSVHRRAIGGGPTYGATKLAARLDVAELLDVERAARRAIDEHRWVIMRGSLEWPLARQVATARHAHFVWPPGN